MEIDGRQVTIPQGKPIKNPALKGATSFEQSEHVLYKEGQVRIRYVLRIKWGISRSERESGIKATAKAKKSVVTDINKDTGEMRQAEQCNSVTRPKTVEGSGGVAVISANSQTSTSSGERVSKSLSPSPPAVTTGIKAMATEGSLSGASGSIVSGVRTSQVDHDHQFESRADIKDAGEMRQAEQCNSIARPKAVEDIGGVAASGPNTQTSTSNEEHVSKSLYMATATSNRTRTSKMINSMDSFRSSEEDGPARWEFESDEAYLEAKLEFDNASFSNSSTTGEDLRVSDLE
jgi:hypothetical protein